MDGEKRVNKDKQRTEFAVNHVGQTVKIIKHLLSWKKSSAQRYVRTITKQRTGLILVKKKQMYCHNIWITIY